MPDAWAARNCRRVGDARRGAGPRPAARIRRIVPSPTRSDVFLQNYRPGVAKRLGMDYGTVKQINPDIVYASISGYGEIGPYVNRPGQDLLLQGLSGMMMSAGRKTGAPHPAPSYVVDAVTAYTAFEAVLAGLLHRARSGEGQYISVSMLDAIIAFQLQEMSIYSIGHVPQRRTDEPHAHVYIRAPYAAYEAKDGRYIILAFPPLDQLGATCAPGRVPAR